MVDLGHRIDMKNQQNKPKQKKYYDVRIETMLPATIVYRVFAEDAESAFNEVSKTTSPVSIKYVLSRRKDIKAMVYDAGCTVIRFIKNIGNR